MALFSERYGYTKVNNVIIVEKITPEIENAICNCYDELKNVFDQTYMDILNKKYEKLELSLWTLFLNQRGADFYPGNNQYRIVAVSIIQDKTQKWFQKLSLIEMTLSLLPTSDRIDKTAKSAFIKSLNTNFERLHFGYRIIGDQVVPINSLEESDSIENALRDTKSNVKKHLSTALKLFAKKPEGDYQNSIKESISAIEAFCREKTGAKDLRDALNKMESKGFVIHLELRKAMAKLYDYTNDSKAGIRHALMDKTEEYIPSSEEALYMLVTCSAFINYLVTKESKI